MEALDHTLFWDWCRAHGVLLVGDDDGSQGPIWLADDPTLTHRARVFYAEGTRSGREPAVAAAAVGLLGPWDECVVWVREWGVWASGEYWPRFYAWRGAHGERRSLEAAPGHRFSVGQTADLVELLTQVLENGWDTAVLPAFGGAATDRRVVTSHDEWIDLRSRAPVDFIVPAG